MGGGEGWGGVFGVWVSGCPGRGGGRTLLAAPPAIPGHGFPTVTSPHISAFRLGRCPRASSFPDSYISLFALVPLRGLLQYRQEDVETQLKYDTQLSVTTLPSGLPLEARPRGGSRGQGQKRWGGADARRVQPGGPLASTGPGRGRGCLSAAGAW